MENIIFYKFVELNDLDSLQVHLLQVCKSLSLKGKILLAKEGINGCVSGEKNNLDEFISIVKSDERFFDINFKFTPASSHTFRKLFVRVRDEILASSWVDKRNLAASYIEPKELKKLLDNNDDVVLFDVRNGYEFDIGHFKNAIKIPTNNFKELPEVLPLLNKYKDKKIVTYCTGGIRCEKATVFLKENGFNNIKQLHGGIVQYGLDFGNAHWDGKCFVFDTRGAIDLDPDHMNEPISICYWCRQPSANYVNCAKLDCDKFFVSCPSCVAKHKSSCSKKCRSLL